MGGKQSAQNGCDWPTHWRRGRQVPVRHLWPALPRNARACKMSAGMHTLACGTSVSITPVFPRRVGAHGLRHTSKATGQAVKGAVMVTRNGLKAGVMVTRNALKAGVLVSRHAVVASSRATLSLARRSGRYPAIVRAG